MYAVHKLKFKYFSKLSVVGIIISIFLLVFVYFIGMEINGKPMDFTGEFVLSTLGSAKVVVLVFMSRQISKHRNKINNWKGFCWKILLPLLIICALILPSNFSTSILVFINGFVLMIFARLKLKFLLHIITIGIFGISMVYFVGKYIPSFQQYISRSVTWVNRIDGYFSPTNDHLIDKGHQLNESKT